MVFTLIMISLTSAAFAQNTQGFQARRGNVYAYMVPNGWMANDSTNGVDMVAPDGSASVHLGVMAGFVGRLSLQQILNTTLNGLQYSNAQALSSQPCRIGQFAGRDITFQALLRGRPIIGHVQVLVQYYYNSTYAQITVFHDVPERWQAEAPILARLASNITVANSANFANRGAIMMPRNHPMDATFAGTMQSWQNKNRAQDRAMQNWSEATLGQYRGRDTNGNLYTLPNTNYDGTVGGYRNPTPGHHDEVLQHADPGE